MRRTTRWITNMALMIGMTMPFAISANAQHNHEFYNGARSRHSYNDDYDRHRYRDDHHDHGRHRTGKGALIGGAGGAALATIW